MIGRRTRLPGSAPVSGGLRLIAVALLKCIAVSCGGSGIAPVTSSNSTAPPPAANNSPTIRGVPVTQVTQDQEYTFTPLASDPDGDPLGFSITNLPSWASFDANTSNLAGTPGDAHVGTTLSVTISVSDGTASVSLAPFDLEVRQIQLGSATVSWEVPSTNADGSALTDLAGYRVHYGTTSQNYTSVIDINDANANVLTVDDLEPGTWFLP